MKKTETISKKTKDERDEAMRLVNDEQLLRKSREYEMKRESRAKQRIISLRVLFLLSGGLY
jgi:hypothetical protein